METRRHRETSTLNSAFIDARGALNEVARLADELYLTGEQEWSLVLNPRGLRNLGYSLARMANCGLRNLGSAERNVGANFLHVDSCLFTGQEPEESRKAEEVQW
jgi:hypothetical protein